ncbi:hypothetical protein VNO77_34495 [Canavalia gladiata]|uniref:Uncharacterized protein n=1 Tax=Canavalia gladiata TaxID=3824 RepID=A0AAN9KGN1_CANGL
MLVQHMKYIDPVLEFVMEVIYGLTTAAGPAPWIIMKASSIERRGGKPLLFQLADKESPIRHKVDQFRPIPVFKRVLWIARGDFAMAPSEPTNQGIYSGCGVRRGVKM